MTAIFELIESNLIFKRMLVGLENQSWLRDLGSGLYWSEIFVLKVSNMLTVILSKSMTYIRTNEKYNKKYIILRLLYIHLAQKYYSTHEIILQLKMIFYHLKKVP